MTESRDRERLLEILMERSVRRGQFVLSSGRTSDLYVDCRRTTLHPEGAWLTARVILACLDREGIEAEAIGGLTLGADPIASSVAAVSHHLGRPLPAFLVRKKMKEHGTRQRIEGSSVEGARVVIVEDVVTTGGSVVEAVEAVREAGGSIAAVIALVDRGEGGAEALSGLRFIPVFTRADLLRS